MQSWEDKLIPREGPWSPLVEVVHLAGLVAVLVVLWVGSGIEGAERQFHDVVGQLVGYYTPAALAMLLAMRCGVLDVSVWMSWSAGSVVAAGILHAALPVEGGIHAGGWPVLAFVAAAFVGAVIGAVNAWLVRMPRLPALLATAMTALLVWGLLQGLTSERHIPVHPRVFDAWHLEADLSSMDDDDDELMRPQRAHAPLSVTRMFLVALIVSAVLLTMLIHHNRTRNAPLPPTPPARVRTLALVAGGAMSALGGALWLLENNAAAVPRLPVHDLRIPLAAVLAGGLVLAGPGRSLLSALCLPVGMLIATLWLIDGWNFNYRGYALQMLPPLAVAIAAGLVLRTLAQRRRRDATGN